MDTAAPYRLWAPVYDRLFGPAFRRARRRSIEHLALRPGEKLLLPGVGTGLDLPLLPPGVPALGIDLSPQMLAQARRKRSPALVDLREMDAQALRLPDRAFDAAALHLVVSVVPDGAKALAEAWRTLRPGGRLVIFDKFLPDAQAPGFGRRVLGAIARRLGTDPNRHLDEILGPLAAHVDLDEPSLLRGQYRIVRLRMPA